ncbi:hypothetical protein DUI87_18145 [Hirundo rustica rustica]|uniref:BACK domain-containing protein n=1 Tax=Hirundo rustica rustica TaxID=333673 RepID=A0A3M0JW48_HIRRU|nr:hypothetical protein DUI87_18145 [Hirundo rustica rustica]
MGRGVSRCQLLSRDPPIVSPPQKHAVSPINYTYTGTVPITEDNVENLLTAADQFNVMGIVSLCCQFLSSRLCFENCIGICRLTDYYYCPDLRAAACVYILHHFEEVSQVSEEFLHLSAEDLTHIIEKVYICGGFDGDQCLSSAEMFNPTRNQWFLIAPMSSRRSGVGVMAYGNQVYAVGGFDGNSRLQSVEAYNPITNTWHAVPSILNPHSNFGIEVMDGLLFVVGGFSGFSTTVATGCYEEDTNEWYDAQSMGTTRSAVSCCVVPGLSNVMDHIARHHYHHSSSIDILFTSSTQSSPL